MFNKKNIKFLFLLSILQLNISLSSCNKKEKIDSETELISESDSSKKICCEKKPARFTSSDSLLTDSINTETNKEQIHEVSNTENSDSHSGMVWVTGGEFIMGTNAADAYDVEKPAHPVKVDGFWMDVTEVTNEDFKKFTDATGYKTVAEKIPDWTELKKQLPPGTAAPDPKDLVAASLVYIKPKNKVRSTDDVTQWWSWVPGANWKNPEGPGSSIKDRMNFPVVQISYDDALAYCKWSGKRLPTEAEWEFAARNCQTGKRFAWGDDAKQNGKFMANTWQGVFPDNDKGEDGYIGLAPAISFEANCYGLFNMTGNVWEWTSDWYDSDAYRKMSVDKVSYNPKGPSKSNDYEDQYAIKRVVKGGSFLCSDNYCLNYRPSARRGQAYDSGTSNIGFRCVK